ncbi:hypothetical protein P261_00578 [Lachnospiraceae bacterium TWA4]|nr:hypothetical protein P261_00578 [Lachnospiraceae bacterium TWA4]
MFEIYVDSAANLPAETVKKYGIHVIPLHTYVNDEEIKVFDPTLTQEEERKLGKKYYDAIRQGAIVRSSLINQEEFEEVFEEKLKEGVDILYISLSKNISGTYNAARLASEELLESYPERKICLVDSLNASLAQGILAIYAYEMREKGEGITAIATKLSSLALQMNGVFTVGNLKYLAKTGRINTATAYVGNVLSIKPILRGNKDGYIVQFEKIRGRKKAVQELIDLVCANIIEPEKQIIGIAQADVYEESLYIMEEIQKRVKVREFINTSYDYCTGSHVGPDTLALFL